MRAGFVVARVMAVTFCDDGGVSGVREGGRGEEVLDNALR